MSTAASSPHPTSVVVRRFVETLEARDWDAWTEVMHPDVVYRIPQTREQISGRDAYVRFNREFPGEWHLTPKRVIGEDDQGVCWFGWQVGDESADAVAFFVVRDGLVTEVTDFWPEPYDPPPGREHLVTRW